MEKMEKATGSSAGKKRGKSGAAQASEPSTTRRAAHEADATEKTDALELLKEQHREVKQLFSQFEEAEDDGVALEVARTICQKLTVHATIEEEIFYPAVREKKALEDMVLEALEEHLSVKRLIGDIEEAQAGDETLDAKLSVLEEQVTHHVKEEETELFPRAKKELSKEERQEMGQRLQARAEALEAGGGPGSADEGEGHGQADGSDDGKRAERHGSASSHAARH